MIARVFQSGLMEALGPLAGAGPTFWQRFTVWLDTGLAASARSGDAPDDPEAALRFVLVLEAAELATAADLVALEIENRTPFAVEDVAAAYGLIWTDAGIEAHVVLVPRLSQVRRPGDAPLALSLAGRRVVLAPDQTEPAASPSLRLNRQRLAVAVLALALTGVGAWVPVWRGDAVMERAQASLRNAEQRATVAGALSRRLSTAREQRQGARLFDAGHPDLSQMLAWLTDALDDETYLLDLRYEDRTLTLRGRSDDAAALIEILGAVPQFAEVEFAAPVTRTGDEKENFSIQLTVGVVEAGEG